MTLNNLLQPPTERNSIMKAKINLRDYLEDNAGSGINVQAHIDTDDILEALPFIWAYPPDSEQQTSYTEIDRRETVP
jgi:hypothetical protein